MKKIYIAGCGGMLSEAFQKRFSQAHELKCTDKDVNENWLSFLDFRDLDAYRRDVTAFRPDVLFHLGTHTDLEYCEGNIEDAYATNTMSVENAVCLANELDVVEEWISANEARMNRAPTFEQAAYEHCIRRFPERIGLPDTYPFNNTTDESVATHFGVKRLFFENVPRVATGLRS